MATAEHKPEESNSVEPTYTWQNPQPQKLVDLSNKPKLAAIIVGGVVIFFGLAVLLAFV